MPSPPAHPADERAGWRPARFVLTDVLAVARGWLPRGHRLPDDVWAHRHRLITAFALLQAVALAVFGMAVGRGPEDSLVALTVTATPALVGLMRSAPRRLRMLSVVVSLMFASMSTVELSGGVIEAHFHFFVMIGVVALYQDWSAFGLCVFLTVAHHATMGLLAPDVVFGSSLEREHPIRWAIIHGAFVLAASVTHVIAWKLNEQQSLQDPATRLPNRNAFEERARTLERAAAPYSVLYVDLDNVRGVNEAYGSLVGDAAIYHAGHTMTEIAARYPGRGLVARLGGDEFAVVVALPLSEAGGLAEAIVAALSNPFSVDGHEVFVTASIGVADTEVVGSRSTLVVTRCADLAANLAKASGKGRVVAYTSGVDAAVLERAALKQDVRSALELGQLEIYYQPALRLVAGRPQLCGVEALLRWHHPTRGLVPPDEFIGLAEETEDITAIGAWVLRAAAAQVARWQRELPGCADLELAVNLSPAQVRDPELLTFVSAALHESGLAASDLMLEVTESMLLSDLDRASRNLETVRRLGARVAIDDFGTGYSSLSYLAQLPADQVKIDRSFVRDLAVDATSVALVRSILDLASALGLDVQAEGVEEPEQQRVLVELGCPRYQGYLYSRPLPADRFAAYARTTDPAPATPAAAAARRAGSAALRAADSAAPPAAATAVS